MSVDYEYEFFISHASEDKEEVARPIALELQNRGIKIWFDEFSLMLGDSIRRNIEKGLSNSRFGVIILSPNFLEKEWPQRELDGLSAREISGGQVILPIWHQVSYEDVLRYSPSLADKLALNTSKGIGPICDSLEQKINGDKGFKQEKPKNEDAIRKGYEVLTAADGRKYIPRKVLGRILEPKSR